MTQEKRKHKRLTQKIKVRHRIENEDRVENTEAKDISTGGLRITTDSRLNLGSKICVEMNLSSSTLPYYAIGEVIWFKENKDSEKKFDIGIKFLRIVSKVDVKGF